MTTFTEETSLLTLLPATYREVDTDGSLQAFFAGVDSIWSSIVTDMENFDSNVLDPAPNMVDYWLAHRANPFTFPMTDDQKFRLVDGLFRIYQLRGSETGLVGAIRYILGLDVSVKYDFEYCWRLGVSRLGNDTILLGANYPNAHILIPGEVTPDILTAVSAIVEFMKPHWLRFIIVGGAIVAPSQVMLGTAYDARVVAVMGATDYVWSISNGTILSGQGTEQIHFNASMAGLVTITLAVTTAQGTTSISAVCNAYASMDNLVLVSDDYQPAGNLSASAQLQGNFYKVAWSGSNLIIQGASDQSTVTFNIGQAGIATQLIANAYDIIGNTLQLVKTIKVVPYTSSDSYTTSNLGPNGNQNFEMDLGWEYDLVSITTSSPAWIRIYNSAADRDSDAERSATSDPTDNSPIVWEGFTTADNLTIPDMPNVKGCNKDTPRIKKAYLAIQNTSVSSTPVTITVTRTETRTSGTF